MSKNFEMSDLGKLTYYLGIEVKQEETKITIKQGAYAQIILKEAGLLDCNPTHVPMDPGMKLSKSEEEQEIDPTKYRKLVGCL